MTDNRLLKKVVVNKGIISLAGFDAGKIQQSLSQKYSDAIYVSECKNGSTWSNNHLLRLDGWALLKTYSPLTTIGFEIKVSRADFEQDQKWVDYLPYCHQFYFVCPAGLIRSDELPENVGLMWVSNTGNIRVKRQSPRHEPDLKKLSNLMVYVLMSRSQNVSDKPQTEIWREEIESAANRKELAYFIKGKIKEVVKHWQENEATMTLRESRVKEFSEQLKRLGIIWDSTKSDWQTIHDVERQINTLRKNVDFDTLRAMENLSISLKNCVDEIRGITR